MTEWKRQLFGLPDHHKPLVDLNGNQTFWDIVAKVNAALKRDGLFDKAEEFRALAVTECDQDNGMVLTLALAFVRVPGQEFFTEEST